MARSEEPLESSLSSRWFIPGGVQRARPKKIEALSREGEREEEGAPEEETHTHTHVHRHRQRRPSEEEVNVRSEVHCLGGKKAGEGEEVYTWRRE